jgi:hypothetical protein
MSMHTYLRVYGATLHFETNSQPLFDEFIKEFRCYVCEGILRAGGKISIFEEKKVDFEVPEGAVRDSIVFPSTAMYSLGAKIFLLEKGKYFITIDQAKCEANVRVKPSNSIFEKIRFIAKRFIIRLLEDRGILSIHGSAVANDGGASVFTGVSGSGKTTSLLTMLETGYRMVADDVVLVDEDVALPFYLRSMIHKDTLKRFPSLSPRMAKSSTWIAEADGWWLNLADIYPAQLKSTIPKAIFNTHVWNSTRSSCKKAEPSRLLSNLVRNYSMEAGAIFQANPEQLKKVFSTYSNIVERTPCYDLYIGRDLKALARTIEGAIQ